MRIIAGRLGGRTFEAPSGHRTHPMSDKIRGGLFNTLGDVSGLTVLDAFAGSGALTYEALSRGVVSALAIETDRRAQQVIVQNLAELGLNARAKLVKANVSSWSDNNSDQLFDLVMLDPPHDHLQLSLIQKVSRHLGPNGTLVLCWPGNLSLPELAGLALLKKHDYNDAQLAFYKVIGVK